MRALHNLQLDIIASVFRCLQVNTVVCALYIRLEKIQDSQNMDEYKKWAEFLRLCSIFNYCTQKMYIIRMLQVACKIQTYKDTRACCTFAWLLINPTFTH